MADEQENQDQPESIGDDRRAAQAGLSAGHSMQGGTAPPGPGGPGENQSPSDMDDRGSIGVAQDGSEESVAENDAHGSKQNASAALGGDENEPADTKPKPG